MSSDSAENRLTEIEIKLTYQDDLLKTLDQVIIELRGEIDILRARIVQLEEGDGAGHSDKASNERPPHY